VSVKFSTDERLSGLSGVIWPAGATSACSTEIFSLSLPPPSPSPSLPLSLPLSSCIVTVLLRIENGRLCGGSRQTREAVSRICVVIQLGA